MAKYIVAYYGGRKPATPEEGASYVAKFKAWLDNVGNDIVNPGTPLAQNHFISDSGNVDNTNDTLMTGFSVFTADSIECALELTKSCPHLDIGGSVEVAQMMEM